MAFGKNPDGLASVGSFRQVGQAWGKRKEQRPQRTGGSVPSWVNEYKPSTERVETIRIIPGEYKIQDGEKEWALPYFPFAEHYDARSKRRAVCSAGHNYNDRTKRAPCHGCDLFWEGIRNKKSGGPQGFMSRRELVAFTVIHLHPYHRVPQRDSAGLARLNPNTGDPYYTWLACEKSADGRGPCKFCDAQHPIKFGQRLHWAMGTDHFNTLLAKDEEIAACCSSCGGVDTIRADAWICPGTHPDGSPCEDILVDLQSTKLTNKEVEELTASPQHCRACGYHGLFREVLVCTGCDNPTRARVFDVDLRLRRINAADGSKKTTLSISSFSAPRPLDPRFVEEEDNKNKFAPEKLDRIYAPTDLEVQAQLFRVDAAPARQPVTAGDAARPYKPDYR